MNKRIKAFDSNAVHLGNRGLGIDSKSVNRQVAELVAQMTLSQKFNELRGAQQAPIDGLYYAGGNDSLGIATFKMVDGPRGARSGSATAFPVAIARAASFDVMLERRVGEAIGLEVAAKGGNVLLAPTINLLRHPGWGRAQETYSEDSFHMGAMAVAFISGAQNHVLTSPKHFALNNLENKRFELSAEIGMRALHEVFLPHFKRCVVEGGAASVMSAYNKVNGVYCGEHTLLLDQILRNDWGFEGFVESDWFLGARSTGASLNAGLDIEMPAAYRFSDENLEQAITSGEIDLSVIDRAVSRILFQKIAWNLSTPNTVDPAIVESDEHLALAQEVCAKSLVLLKNKQSILPLNDQPITKVALVGKLADTANLGDRGSSFVTSSNVVTIKQGLEDLLEFAELQYFEESADWSELQQCDVTVVVAGLTYQEEGEFIPTAQAEAEGGQLARGGDRESLGLPDHQLQLIRRAVKYSKKVVVILEGGSAITISEWIDEVDAVILSWYPGCEGGHAIAKTLFGKLNEFGRLPLSIPVSEKQLMPWDVNALHVSHDLLHGYRYLDHHKEQPAFAFGYGLSYTEFSLECISVERKPYGFSIEIIVKNIGLRTGSVIPQLYVSCSGSSIFRVDKELKGFGRVELMADEQATMIIDLADDNLKYYDETTNMWRLEPCDYKLQVGQYSSHLPLYSSWQFTGSDWIDCSAS